jgi:hypothetical protein
MNRVVLVAAVVTSLWAIGSPSLAQAPPGVPPGAAPRPPDYPPYPEVIKDYEKVVSTMDGKPSMYTIWLRRKDNQVLAELPPDYVARKYFIAMTVASGDTYAGLQAGDMYVYWRPYDKRLALMEPNLGMRTSAPEAQSSVKRLFTDRVILDTPILTMSPQGGPVIDLDAVLVGQSARFFGTPITNAGLVTVKTAKAFPQNIEVSFEAPMAGGGGRFHFLGGGDAGGRLKTIHYSISVIPDSTGYQARVADQRVGYFTTTHTDLGKYKDEEKRIRYVNRWKLEKADPSLALSPPKEPIIFYIEHSTPVRYRPWVERGILYWNRAFEKVGIRGAIRVEQQNENPPAHMDKDPEDVRYNFIRWLANDQGTAIGPSRVHPLTGEILDADVILTDGWIRHYARQHTEVLPKLAMEGYGPETLAWLDAHPNWDPRILCARPSERSRLIAERMQRGPQPYGGHPLATRDRSLMGNNEYDGLVGRLSQVNGLCLAAENRALDVALWRMLYEVTNDPQEKKAEPPKKEEPKKEEPPTNMLDGMPEDFIGPLLAELVAHEVGHTLGLRHNFKASSIYALGDINSDKVKGKPQAGSVMDYLPVNINMGDGKMQGDWCMVDVGPYDVWAIEFGYGADKDLKAVLDRVAQPELQYATDEDTWGPDPLARRYDFSANPLDYAKNQLKIARFHRERLVDKFVKEGDSWSKARRGYEMTLYLQTRSLSMMANWIGGSFVHRDKKGDKGARPPVEVVPVQQQRDALKWVIDNSFFPESFGLTAEVLRYLAADHWMDGDDPFASDDPDYPVHDRLMSIQASTLTMLMNPTTLRRVYDNELRTPAEQDMLTLPELLDAVGSSIWRELDQKPAAPATPRKPWISSLRRNLQREHLERLIELTLPDAGFTAAYKPISNLAIMRLRELKDRIDKAIEAKANIDAYSLAHLSEAQVRIAKALDAQYIYNSGGFGGGRLSPFLFLRTGESSGN